MSAVVVHYGELALKGRNRPWFLSTLVKSIRSALRGLGVRDVRSVIGRIIVTLGPEADWPEIRDRLRFVPGVTNFSYAEEIPADIDVMATRIVAALAGETTSSFRVTVRRADKRFVTPSPEVERIVGRRVQEAMGWRVDLSHPALVIRIEVLSTNAFFSFRTEKGTGGLPVGTGGRVLALMSGGIDSPVAAWRLIRRGCRADFVHFHSYPILSRASQDKARELVTQLTRFQLKSRLYLVPFGGIQQQIVLAVPPALRVVIYRRFMVRIAEQLARRTGALALVTGDAVAQVASQTLENLAVVGSVATLPLLRPLVGMDKEEITADAQRIGTYGVSILEDEDCCTLFTPRFPSTRAAPGMVEDAERALDVDRIVAGALEEAQLEQFGFPMLQSQAFAGKEGAE